MAAITSDSKICSFIDQYTVSVGASLLAKAVGQPTSMEADRLHSRAGSLPQF
ncbi:hypothetical protein PG5_62210 [Pseudomonas sp. G5(2012)]|nr:hypothetical protein PG5_62210 [Pseudomonas sp. G5(2012)]